MPVAHLVREMSVDEFHLWQAYHELVASERDAAMKSRQSDQQARTPRAFGR